MKSAPLKCPFGFQKSKANIEFYDRDRYLVNFSEIGKDYNHSILNSYSKQILDVDIYLQNVVSQENDQLGRSGVVCPYTPGAFQRENLYFTVYKENLTNRIESKELVLDYMNLFLSKEPTSGKYRDFKSILILLPEVSNEYSEEVIERVQNELKQYFVKNGLMIGQFYPNCSSPGIHNPKFRPLKSPIPLLVIRYMVKYDYVFLEDYEEEYFRNFQNNYDPKALDFFACKSVKRMRKRKGKSSA